MRLHPWLAFLRAADHHSRERFIGIALGHAQQVVEIFVLTIAISQHRQRPVMHTAKIARVAGVSAAIALWGCLQYQNLRACLRSLNSGAEGGIAAANDDDVERRRHVADLTTLTKFTIGFSSHCAHCIQADTIWTSLE